MPFKKNRLMGEIDFLNSSTSQYYDRVMNTLNGDIEELSLSNKRLIFKAICLSGASGITTPGSNSSPILNTPQIVDFGDGTPRFGIRFRVQEDGYGTNSMFHLTDVIPSPFESGITEEERQWRISQHPMAYTELSARHSKPYAFGSVLSIKQMGHLYMILSVFGKGGVASPTTSTDSSDSKSSFDGGKEVPNTSDVKVPTKKPRNLLPASAAIKSGDFVLLFGDSQTEGYIGKGSEKYFKSIGANVVRIFKRGAQPVYWSTTGWSKLNAELKKSPKLVIMTLGGNGTKGAVEMIDKVKGVSPSSSYIWIGAPPPAVNGTKNGPGQAYDYTKKYPSRGKNNEFLKSNISSKVTHFINPYEVPEFTKGYRCPNACDGIHVPKGTGPIMLVNAGVIKDV